MDRAHELTGILGSYIFTALDRDDHPPGGFPVDVEPGNTVNAFIPCLPLMRLSVNERHRPALEIDSRPPEQRIGRT